MRLWLAVLVLPILMAAAMIGPDDNFKRERSPKNAAAKDALEGKAPPALAVGDWHNLPDDAMADAKAEVKALDWSQLKGKVVVIDFWGTW